MNVPSADSFLLSYFALLSSGAKETSTTVPVPVVPVDPTQTETFSLNSFSPSAGAVDISTTTPINLLFNSSVNLISIVTNTGSGTCTGSIQFSTDNFSTCLAVSVDASSNPQIIISPNPNWPLQAQVSVKVQTALENANGISLDKEYSFSFTTGTVPAVSVNNVSSSNADGMYYDAQNIDIQVFFSDVVTVSGSPFLQLETGTTDANAVYLSGSGTNTLVFRYTVLNGHSSADLDYLSTSALSLNGGSIQDKYGRDASLILPTPAAASSLSYNKNISIGILYKVGFTVQNLSGTGLILQNNASDNLAIPSNGTYTFATLLGDTQVYDVTVLQQPAGQYCGVINRAGKIQASDVSNVLVDCQASYTSFVASTSGVISYWRLGEIGATATDSISGLNGTYFNTPNQNVSGAIMGDTNGAVFLNGSTQYIEVFHSAGISPTSALSLNLWIFKHDSSISSCNAVSGIVSKFESGGYELSCNNTNIQFTLRRNSIDVSISFALSSVPYGWHMLSATYDGQIMKLYLDAGLKASNDAGAVYPIDYTISNSLILGAASGTSGPETGTYAGVKIDELSLYNRGLEAGEILEHFKLGTRLVRNYNFKAGSLSDSSKFSSLTHTLSSDSGTSPSPVNSGFLDTHGELGGAYYFDGTGTDGSGFVSYSPNDLPLGNSPRTICTWFFPDAYIPSDSTIFGYGNYSTAAGNFIIGISNHKPYVASTGLGFLQTSSSPAILKDWTHLCASYDGKIVILYVNGMAEAPVITSLNTTFTKLLIGKADAGTNKFTGRVDDVKVYNTALSAEQIRMLSTKVPDGLIAHYDFKGNERDMSGFGQHLNTINVTAVNGRLGVSNTAYSFNGVDSEMVSNVIHLPTSNKPRTLCTWMNPKSLTSQTLSSYGSPLNSKGFGLSFDSSNLIGMGFADDVVFNKLSLLAHWSHVCLSYDGSIARLYKNGIELNNATKTWMTGSSQFQIGFRMDGQEYYSGLMQDVRLYSRALNSGEIASLSGEPYFSEIGPSFFNAFQKDLLYSYRQGSGSVSDSSTGSFLNGGKLWSGGVLAPNGKIYAMPFRAKEILVINTNDQTTYTIALPAPYNNGLTEKWSGGVLAKNGKIYGIPYDASHVLIIDYNNETAIDVVSIDVSGIDTGSNKWKGGSVGANGMIYCAPYSSSQILKINPDTGQLSLVGPTMAGLGKYSGATLAPNGQIYLIPYNSSRVFTFDSRSEGFFITMGGTYTNLNKWSGAAIGLDGDIYAVPDTESSVLKISTDSQTTSLLALPGSVVLPASGKFSGAVLAPNGKIFGIPHSSGKVLSIDVFTQTLDLSYSVGLAPKKWESGILSFNGIIYAIPHGDGFDISPLNVLMLKTGANGSFIPHTRISAYLNKF